MLKLNAQNVVIVSALRTPFTRAAKGALANTYPEELLTQIPKAVVKRTAIPRDQVHEVSIGTVLRPLGGQQVSAMAVKKCRIWTADDCIHS